MPSASAACWWRRAVGLVEEIPAPDGLGVYACMLGGPDGTTLLQCCAPGFLAHERREADDARLVATEVEVPHAGPPCPVEALA